MIRSKFILPGLVLAFASGAFAQGDDCSTATAIATTGAFAFDTTVMLTTSFDGGGSCGTGSDTINQDAFWQWTAPAAGDYAFDTFGSSFDTKLSVHTGVGCAATCADYNDDTGGLQSEVTLSGLSMGDTVLVQVGGYGANAGPGILNISTFVDPCALPDDIHEENDDCASAAAMVDGTYPGLFASSTDKDHYSFCVADGSTVDVSLLFTNAQADMDVVLWDAADFNCGTGHGGASFLAEGFSASDNEDIAWSNLSGSDLDVILEVNLYSGDCNTYDLIIAGSGACTGLSNAGTPFCDPNNNNSTGVPAVLSGTWGSGVGSDLHLDIADGVPGQLVILLVGTEATSAINVSNGDFCLIASPTAQFFHYNVAGGSMNSVGNFSGSGAMVNAAGTSTTGFGFDVPNTIPSAAPTTIMAGDSWHFQGWYRDTPAGVGSSNFTNGLSVTF